MLSSMNAIFRAGYLRQSNVWLYSAATLGFAGLIAVVTPILFLPYLAENDDEGKDSFDWAPWLLGGVAATIPLDLLFINQSSRSYQMAVKSYNRGGDIDDVLDVEKRKRLKLSRNINYVGIAMTLGTSALIGMGIAKHDRPHGQFMLVAVLITLPIDWLVMMLANLSLNDV